MKILQRSSPFYNRRPVGTPIDLVVLHFITVPDDRMGGLGVDALFMGTYRETQDPHLQHLRGLEVSSHYWIRRNGQVRAYVDPEKRAWHAGRSIFHGVENCNHRAIGIELEGSAKVPFEEAQYQSLFQLLDELSEKYPLRWITGHEHIAPTRKNDPGPYFSWDRLNRHCPYLIQDLRNQEIVGKNTTKTCSVTFR